MRILTPRIKSILSVPLSLKDIQVIDDSLFRSMNCLRTRLKEDPSLEDTFDLYFSVDITTSVDGDVRSEEVDLMKGGRNRRVSSENVNEYSELMMKHYLYDNYRNTLFFLLEGIFEVIPQEFFCIFSEEELTKVLEGEKSAVWHGAFSHRDRR